MNAARKIAVVAVLLALFTGCCCFDRGWNAPCRRPWCPADWCWGDQCTTENHVPTATTPSVSVPANVPLQP